MKKLHIGGFGWTGSGAIIDMFSQYAGVGYVRHYFEEASFFKGKYSILTMYNRTTRGELMQKSDFWSLYGALTGQYPLMDVPEYPEAQTVNLKRNELLTYKVGRPYINVCHDFLLAGCTMVEQHREASEQQAWFETATAEFLDQVLAILPDEHFNGARDVIIFNNDPSGYNIDAHILLKPDTSIIVYRDLRDVFCTLIKETGLVPSEKTVKDFITRHRSLTKNFRTNLKAGKYGANTHLIDFDRFVTSEECREHVLTLAPAIGEKLNSSYDVSKSLQNVELRNKMDLDETARSCLAQIDAELMEEWRGAMAEFEEILAH